MKSYVFLLLAFLTLTNARLTTFGRENSYHHAPNTIFNTIPYYTASSKSTTSNDKILRNDMDMKKDGSYRYQYETSNGITGMEKGFGGVSVQGANSYISPEGVEIKTTYTADENGYHPVGDHIPKTPDYILRALEYIRTHPPKDSDEYKIRGNNAYVKKSPSAPAHRISTHIAPPTRKPTPRKQAPTTKRSNSFAASGKLTAKNQKNYKRY